MITNYVELNNKSYNIPNTILEKRGFSKEGDTDFSIRLVLVTNFANRAIGDIKIDEQFFENEADRDNQWEKIHGREEIYFTQPKLYAYERD